jgi:hypothetical protein
MAKKTSTRNAPNRSATKKKAKTVAANKTRKVTKKAAAATVALKFEPVPVIVRRAISGGGRLGAKLNGKMLVFQSDVAHALVGPGQRNVLERRVVGPPGAKWRLAVIKPSNTGCDNSGTLGPSGREAGVCAFQS